MGRVKHVFLGGRGIGKNQAVGKPEICRILLHVYVVSFTHPNLFVWPSVLPRLSYGVDQCWKPGPNIPNEYLKILQKGGEAGVISDKKTD